ncbi:helix-turn-helix domain-containing protein [Geobacillus sp. FSL W8-1251]|uniref:helix-turn-helix domain-containing protein n=1 Tax=Geobacillus sp. FSL W8-1251 TaxID=2954650 RepID=UPI00155E235E|nr:XRE family transcriptional regulator [Geobacillus sp. MMMUD3]
MKYTIAQARALSGLSQREMAKRLGISEKTYIDYEKYRKVFRMDMAYKFSKITGIEMDEIIFFDKDVQKICS